MDAQTFLDNFATIAEAPGGLQRLRELVLELAVRGQLVGQEPADASAAVLLDSMPARRDALVASGAIGRPRHPEGVAVDDPPHEIPASWAWVRLGDVGAVVGGGTPKSGEPAYWADGSDVPWLTPADMRSQASRLISSGARDITARGLAESSAQLLPAGSVLFSSRAPIGHVGIAAQPLATNQGFKSCVPYVSEMTEYLYLFLRYVGPIVDASATGTTFKEVSGKQVALIPVPVPPLAEQERIVAKVDELLELCDDLEAHQEHRHRATSRFRSSALHALTEAETPDDLRRAWERVSANWRTLTRDADAVDRWRQVLRDLAVKGRLAQVGTRADSGPDACYESLNDRAAARDLLGAVPSGWKCVTLGDLLVDGLTNGASPKPAVGRTGVTSLKLSATTKGVFDQTQSKQVDLSAADAERYWLEPGDLLIQRSNTPQFVGVAALYDGPPRKYIYPDLMMRGRILDGVDGRFVHISLLSSTARAFIQSRASGTSQSMVKVTQKAVMEIPIALPSRAEQRRVVAAVDALEANLARLATSLERQTDISRSLAESVAHAQFV